MKQLLLIGGMVFGLISCGNNVEPTIDPTGGAEGTTTPNSPTTNNTALDVDSTNITRPGGDTLKDGTGR